MRKPSVLTQIYGTLLLLLLSPIIAKRLLEQRQRRARARAMFQPAAHTPTAASDAPSTMAA